MATLHIEDFPDELYRRLRVLADRERRSLVQQMIHLLGQAVEESEPRSLLELKGLGKEHWQGVDADRHVETERAGWDGSECSGPPRP